MVKDKKIGIIGTGNMGESLISGLICAKSSVPRNIICSDVRKERLKSIKDTYGVITTASNTEVIKEWREDGIVCRYVIYTIGTFKGAMSRCAAFYTFPEVMKQGPAFVWAHGGGQNALPAFPGCRRTRPGPTPSTPAADST